MEVTDFCVRFKHDVKDLLNDKIEDGERRDILIQSVALRALSVLMLALCASIVIGGIVASAGTLLPIVTGLFFGILFYDFAVIGHNRSRIVNPRDLLDGLGAAVSVCTSAYKYGRCDLDNTLIIGSMVRC